MNNVRGPREVYTIRGDMCYDNKMMINAGFTEGPPPPPSDSGITLNIPELDYNKVPESNQQQSDQQQCKSKSSSLIKLRSRLRCNRIIDGIIFIVVTVFFGLVEFGFIPSKKIGFTCKDPTISYPFNGETVSTVALGLVSVFGSLFIISIIEVIRERSCKRVRLGTIWYYHREALIGLYFTLFITEIIKLIVGEHRPHFLTSCLPDSNQYCQPGTYITEYTCTNQNLSAFALNDIARSFPSGHTSMSMFISLYCSYLIHLRLDEDSVSRIRKTLFMMLCLTWTCVASFTRITDRRHHWWDVLIGAAIGISVAFYTGFVIRDKTQSDMQLTRNTTSTLLLDVKNKNSTSVMI